MPSADKMSTAPMTHSGYSAGMSQKPKKPSAKEAERRERQAEALRENLRRRKQQSRDREGDTAETATPVGTAKPESD